MRNNSDGVNSRTSPAAHWKSEQSTVVVHTSTQTQSSALSAKTSLGAMIPKRFLRYVMVTCLLVPMAILYVTMFQHPPPDEILKRNGAGGGGGGVREFNWGGFENNEKDSDLSSNRRQLRENEEVEENREEVKEEKSVWDFLEDEEGNEEKKDKDDTEEETKEEKKKVEEEEEKEKEEKKKKEEEEEQKKEAEEKKKEEEKEEEDQVIKAPPKKREVVAKDGALKGKAAWNMFIADNHHTAIGIVLDKCDHASEQLGTVVLMADKENGGVMSRTFYNFTLDRDLEEGTFHIEVKYNGQDLYDNWWELCEMEEDLEPNKRTFVCPIKKGPQSLVKDKHVPGYLPKGRYQSKAWVLDEKKKILVCGYSDFVL